MELVKKYWFVCLVAVVMLAGVVYFAYDQNKGKLEGKKANGQDVVFTIGDQDVTADAFYDTLYSQMGTQSIYQFLEKAVVDHSVATTDEMKKDAKEQADGVITQYKTTYGDTYKENLLLALNAVGYSKESELNDFFIHYSKLTELVKTYSNEKMDTLFPKYNEEKSPRMVSHILIKMDNPDQPTEEEQKRWDTVKEALAGGMDFAEAAKQYSEDTGSAAQNGSIGVMDKDSQLVPEFLDAAIKLNEGQVSEWVKSEYGWHIIKCDTTNLDKLKESDDFYASLAAYYPNLQYDAVWEKAKAMNIDFKGNTELETALKTFMGVKEEAAQ